VVRRPVFLRALALLIGLPALLLGTPPTASAAPSGAEPAPDRTPLVVTIDEMTPSVLPASGPIRISGRVTNRDDVPWTSISLYPLVSRGPMHTRAELAEAAATPSSAPVGERVVDVDDTISELAPGATSEYSITVPRAELAELIGAGEPGIYWFGVHAIAQSEESPRDLEADGRARTFLPNVPAGTPGAVKTSLVLPLRRFLGREPDGSLSNPDAWQRSLSRGGRLREAVDFASAAGPGRLSWLVDPALLDAVQRIADGNPPRSLEPTLQPTEPGETGSPSPTESPTGDEGDDDGDADETDAPPTREQETARSWLSDLEPLLRGQQLLTLPYGDLDLAAAADHDPGLIELADTQASAVLEDWDIDGAPVIGAPSGYLDLGAVEASDPDATVLVSDVAFVDDPPAVAQLGGRKLVVASTGASAGGPGPGDRTSGVALRQRILSEAALRLLEPGRDPLVVVLPPGLTSVGADEFFDGLEVPWLDMTTFDDAGRRRGRPITPDDLVYPERQERLELDQPTFDAVDQLIDDGEVLQNLLTLNDRIGADLTEEALCGVSYTARQTQVSARAGLNRAVGWVEDKLSSVQIGAPPGVTLSSESGDFVATITNRLDQPVTVAIRTRSDPGMEVTAPESVDLAPRSRSSVLLQARTSEAAVHNVTLTLTDADGTPLGSSAQLPIRSAQVSNVIWVIMGTGVLLLFGTILLRLVRRIRRRLEPQDAS